MMHKKETTPSAHAKNQTNQKVTFQSTFSYLSAIGFNDFKKLREADEFVDKSLLIKEIFHDRAGVILITRPRRWGKSSNLDMLKTFLEIEVDEQGNELTLEQKINPTYFVGGEIEEGVKSMGALKLNAHGSIMANLGKYPVMMVNFKNIKCTSYETVEAGLKIAIAKAFKSHRYLLKSKKFTKGEKNKIDNYLLGNIDSQGLQDALADLMEYLNIHFNKKVWVLIDEYDNAIYNAYLNFGTTGSVSDKFTRDFKEVLESFRSLIGSALKDNKNLAKGVLTGILKIAKADLFSELNNVMSYSVLHEEYSPYYGFSQQEVGELLIKLHIPEDKKEMIKEWYNGYNYGGLTLYNPWSIMCCLNKLSKNINAFPENYWSDSGAFGVLQNLFLTDELQDKIQNLLSNPNTHITSLIYPNIDLASLQAKNVNMALSLLLFTGYLNPTYQSKDLHEIDLSIPNQEVVSSFGELIRKWSAKKLNIDEYRLGEIERALISGDVVLFKQELKRFLSSYTSFRTIKDANLSLKESHYHFLMIGILSHLHSKYQIFHELESGEGYVDTVLIPRKLLTDKTQAILLEYKYAKEQDSLSQGARSSLNQINQKRYMSKLKGNDHSHVKQALKIGIAFHKKEVEIVYEVEKL